MSYSTTITLSKYTDILQSITDGHGTDPFLFREIFDVTNVRVKNDGNIEVTFGTEQDLLLFMLKIK